LEILDLGWFLAKHLGIWDADIEGYGRKGQRSQHHIHLVRGLLPCGVVCDILLRLNRINRIFISLIYIFFLSLMVKNSRIKRI
jgi:hypothetical protein